MRVGRTKEINGGCERLEIFKNRCRELDRVCCDFSAKNLDACFGFLKLYFKS